MACYHCKGCGKCEVYQLLHGEKKTTKTCTECGHECPRGVMVCPKCGAPFFKGAPTPMVPPPPGKPKAV